MWANTANEDNITLWAGATTTVFFRVFKIGEITVPSDIAYDPGAHLNFEDVSVDSIKNTQSLKVRVKASKTDPFRVGVDIFVGRTNSSLCPVAAVLKYLTIRGPKAVPLFLFANGKPLTRVRFVERVQLALSLAGVDCSRYSGHSFRCGAATTAANRGIGDTMNKTLGRWQSNAYQLYIKTPRTQLALILRQLTSVMK